MVASIDYRLGFSAIDVEEVGKAQLRAIQDLSSFIRYAKGESKDLKIDTNKIFTTGSSAGGFTVLHQAYLDLKDNPQFIDTTGVGDLEGHGNLNGSSSKVKAIYSMWGAIADTNWINKGDIPVGCIQSIYDPCVPWNYGIACFLTDLNVYGSYSINKRAKNVGIYTTLRGFNSTEHDIGMSNPLYRDTVITEMSNFFYSILCTSTTFVSEAIKDKAPILLYPNPFSDVVNVNYKHSYKYKIISSQGSIIQEGFCKTGKIDCSRLKPGFYIFKMYSGNTYVSRKLVKLFY